MYDMEQIRKALEVAGCTRDQADAVQRCLKSGEPDFKMERKKEELKAEKLLLEVLEATAYQMDTPEAKAAVRIMVRGETLVLAAFEGVNDKFLELTQLAMDLSVDELVIEKLEAVDRALAVERHRGL